MRLLKTAASLMNPINSFIFRKVVNNDVVVSKFSNFIQISRMSRTFLKCDGILGHFGLEGGNWQPFVFGDKIRVQKIDINFP